MPSEMCPVCGKEADADELDPHGHFSTGDDERPDREFTGDLQAAEADLSRASATLQRAEEELAIAEERLEELEDEPFDEESEEDLTRRVAAAEREIEARQNAVSDAEESFNSTAETWRDQGYPV